MTDPDSPDSNSSEQVPPPESPYQPAAQPAVAPPASPYQAPLPPPPVSPYSTGGPQKPPTTLSLLALIFGIIGIPISCCYGAGLLFSLAGVVLGHLGLKREQARGMALGGLITGYVGLGVVLVWIVIGIGIVLFAVSSGR